MRQNSKGNGERGFALVLVLILLTLGSLLIAPMLRLTGTTLKAKQINTAILADQYARDGAAEFGMWQLLYGDATILLNDPGQCPDNICTYSVELSGITSNVTLRMRTELGTFNVRGAEDNKVRSTISVECDIDGDGFDDDCLNLPLGANMEARYSVTLTHVSPDTSSDLMAIYVELPKQFAFQPGTVDSPDSSFAEILSVTPTNIGSSQNQIWKWDVSSSPVSFQQDEAKSFRFLADIDNGQGRYCIGIFLDIEDPSPNEKNDKREAQILEGSSPPDGCNGGGMLTEKFVDQLVTPPNVTTILTYIANIEVFENNSMKLDSVKDVLPQGGFQWCDPANPPSGFTCEAPMYKIADDPFDPQADSFTNTAGYTVLSDPTETLADGRWELLWDNGGGWNLAQAGQSGDTFLLRFQAHVTPTESGSYYNELFADVDCSAPSQLISEGVTSQAEYCASYSWPTGGTLVPMYDVRSGADRTTGQGNVIVGFGGAYLESWHVDNK